MTISRIKNCADYDIRLFDAVYLSGHARQSHGLMVYGMFIAERYMTVFTVAFCVLLADSLRGYDIVLGLWAALWLIRSFMYVRCYQSNETLFRASMRAFPRAAENINHLASWHFNHGQYQKSVDTWQQAMACVRSPRKQSNIHLNLSRAHEQLKQWDKALYHTDEAIKGAAPNKIESLKLRRTKVEKFITRSASSS